MTVNDTSGGLALEALIENELRQIQGGRGMVATAKTPLKTDGGIGNDSAEMNIGIGELQECTISKTMD